MSNGNFWKKKKIYIQFCTPLKCLNNSRAPIVLKQPCGRIILAICVGTFLWHKLILLIAEFGIPKRPGMCHIEPVSVRSVRSVMISVVLLFSTKPATSDQRTYTHWVLQRRRWPMTITGSGPTGRRCDVNLEACSMDFVLFLDHTFTYVYLGNVIHSVYSEYTHGFAFYVLVKRLVTLDH